MKLLFIVAMAIMAIEADANSSCLKIQAIEGEVCPDLSINYDLSECSKRGPITQKSRIACNGNEASVRLKTSQFTYNFILAKEEHWGKVKWKLQGDISELAEKPAKKESARSNAEPTESIQGPVPASSKSEESPIKTSVGGFIDAQFNTTKSDATTQGFVINDGAVYLSGKYKNTTGFLDIPFAGGSIAGTPTPNFNLGLVDAQAYIEHIHDSGLTWKIGQWDAIYGFEVNDTNGVAFTRQGLVFNWAVPFVEAGLLISHNFGLITAKAYVGNPNDTNGIFDSLERLEMGGQFALNHEMLRLTPGLRTKQTVSGRLTHFDLLAGVTLGDWALDFEFDTVKTSGSTRGYAYMAHILGSLDKVREGLSAGARFEFLKDLEGNPTNNRTLQLTVGPQYKLSKILKLKTDYSWQQRKLTAGAAATSAHIFNIAAVLTLGEI